jgi:hypothetical protein
MWKRSSSEECLRNLQHLADESRRLYVYGDYAYQLAFEVMSPIVHARGRRFLSSHEKRFNAALATCHLAMENSFGYIQQH